MYSDGMGAQINEALMLYGLAPIDWPGPAYWVAMILFSVIGMVMLVLARRRKKRLVTWVALALMLYPYVVWGAVPMWVVGVALCALAAWCWRFPGQEDPQRKL
jgi:hypothetical protein